jgi:hypothetical protein
MKKIMLYLLTILLCSLGGLIAPLFGVSLLVGAVISLSGCLIYFGINSLLTLALITIEKILHGEPDAKKV